jgi:hypothetical protein
MLQKKQQERFRVTMAFVKAGSDGARMGAAGFDRAISID